MKILTLEVQLFLELSCVFSKQKIRLKSVFYCSWPQMLPEIININLITLTVKAIWNTYVKVMKLYQQCHIPEPTFIHWAVQRGDWKMDKFFDVSRSTQECPRCVPHHCPPVVGAPLLFFSTFFVCFPYFLFG